jgi:tRNA (cytidine/uridine-2'-O-)-methyltransferase
VLNPLFHIALHEPQIPNNTGNIGRTCVATGCALHLIRPLGFDTSAKACRRAGLDYWPRLAPTEHDTWDAYLAAAQPPRLWLFTTKADRTPDQVEFQPGDHLVFGKETRGLPAALLREHSDRLITLPMRAGERSLNLATAVCAVVYLGIDQFIRRGALALDSAARLPGAARPAPARK